MRMGVRRRLNSVLRMFWRTEEVRREELRERLALTKRQVFQKRKPYRPWLFRTATILGISLTGAALTHTSFISDVFKMTKYNVKLVSERRKFRKQLDAEEKLWDMMEKSRKSSS